MVWAWTDGSRPVPQVFVVAPEWVDPCLCPESLLSGASNISRYSRCWLGVGVASLNLPLLTAYHLYDAPFLGVRGREQIWVRILTNPYIKGRDHYGGNSISANISIVWNRSAIH